MLSAFALLVVRAKRVSSRHSSQKYFFLGVRSLASMIQRRSTFSARRQLSCAGERDQFWLKTPKSWIFHLLKQQQRCCLFCLRQGQSQNSESDRLIQRELESLEKWTFSKTEAKGCLLNVKSVGIFFFFKSCIWNALENEHSAQEPVQSCQTGEESQSTVILSLGGRTAAMEWLIWHFQLIYNLIPCLTPAPIGWMLVFLGSYIKTWPLWRRAPSFPGAWPQESSLHPRLALGQG